MHCHIDISKMASLSVKRSITLVDVFSSFLSSNALATDCIPSVCRMFLYNEFTSMVTKYVRCLEHLQLEKVYL